MVRELPPLKVKTKEIITLELSEAEQKSLTKQQFIDRCYQYGGKDFVEAVRKYGVNEQGEAIKITPGYAEYLELIADFRVHEVYISGAAQCGKTLGNNLLLCYCLTDGGLNTLWAYESEKSLNLQVPSNFKPTIRNWLKRKGLKPSSDDTKNNSLYQVFGATSQFTYTSTSSTSSNDGTAAAGGIAVGVSRDILFVEERSQHKPGSIDPLKRRLDAGRLPSRPIRELGTKGSGQGIEASISQAQYDFHPHYQCRECGHIGALIAKGCLLKPVDKIVHGKRKKCYLSEIGKPLDWHHKDPMDAVETAYFGCSQCGVEIPKEDRVNAWFQCIKTSKTLREFLDSLPNGVPSERFTAAVTLSPLLRIEEINTAAEIIREGLNSKNPADWQQQKIAEVSESGNTNITLDMLMTAMRATRPMETPSFTVAGLDQGRGQDWMMIAKCYIDPGWKNMKTHEILDSLRRVIIWGGAIQRHHIKEKLNEYSVDFAICDNEPDIEGIAKLCDESCFEMADQKQGTPYDVKDSIVYSGGAEYRCWFIRQESFQRNLMNAFAIYHPDGHPLYRLPPEWEMWLSQPTERSPLRHLSSVTLDPDTGKFIRDANGNDDMFFAGMFLEAAIYLYLTKAASGTARDWEKWTQ